MRLKVAMLVATGVVVILGFWIMTWSGEDGGNRGRAPEASAAGPEASSRRVESRPATRLAPPRRSVERAPESAPVSAAAGEALLRGRCVDAKTREPLAGCRVTFHGSELNRGKLEAFVKAHGPVVWSDPSPISTEDDGRFEFSFAPPPPFQFLITIEAAGRATLDGLLHDLKPGAFVDLGDVPMPRGVVLKGRVVDDLGSPRAEVSVMLERRDAGLKLGPRGWLQARSDSDGSFLFATPLAPGTFGVRVRDRQVLEPAEIEIGPADTERAIEVRVRGDSDVDVIAGFVKDDHGDPVENAEVSHWPTEPVAAGIGTHPGTTGKDGSFVIRRSKDEPKGPVRLTVSCRGYETPRDSRNYEWGSKGFVVVLKKGATVTIAVRDGDSGKPIERYGVRCFPAPRTGVDTKDPTRLKNRGTHEGGVLELAGVLRGKQLLIVEPDAGDYQPSRAIGFEMTESGAPRLDVVMRRSVKRTVVVKSQTGKPVAGTRLELLRPVDVERVDLETQARAPSELDRGVWHCALRLDGGETDEDGKREVMGPPHELLALRVLGPGHAPLVKDVTLEGPDGTIDVVVLAGATLVGRIQPLRILDQLDMSPKEEKDARSGPGIVLHPPGNRSAGFPLGSRAAAIGADGSFRLEGIPAGKWTVHLSYLEGPQGARTGEPTVVSGMSGSIPIGTFDLRDGDERHETFDLATWLKAEVEGVATLDGTPIHEGMLAFDGHAEGSPDDRLMTQQVGVDAEGRFKAVVWPGRYRVVAQCVKDGRRRCVQTAVLVSFKAGDKAWRAFDFQSSILKLRILASDGVTPVSGANVEVEIPKPAWQRSAQPSDQDGRTAVDDPPAGPVTIFVWPKRMSAEERRAFLASGKDRAEVLVRVGTVTVTPPLTSETLALPASSGY